MPSQEAECAKVSGEIEDSIKAFEMGLGGDKKGAIRAKIEFQVNEARLVGNSRDVLASVAELMADNSASLKYIEALH